MTGKDLDKDGLKGQHKAGSESDSASTQKSTPSRPTKAPNWVKGQSGNPKGRPKGSRNKLSTKFIDTLAADFAEHGETVIATLRKTDPKAYVNAVGKLVPTQLDVPDDGPVTVMVVKSFDAVPEG